MRAFKLAASVVLVPLLAGCGGAGQQAKPQEPQVTQGPTLKERFRKTYYAIGCMANYDRDPLSTIVPLRRPVAFLRGLAERKDPRLQSALKVLRQNGFASVDAFEAAEKRFKADREFWNETESRFVDELLKCSK